MSFSNPTTLSPDVATAVATNEVSFALRYGDNGKAVYSVAGLTAPEEMTLSISHEKTKSGRLRHLTRIDHTLDDANGVPVSYGIYVVFDRQLSSAITTGLIEDSVNMLCNMLTASSNAAVTKILNQEL